MWEEHERQFRDRMEELEAPAPPDQEEGQREPIYDEQVMAQAERDLDMALGIGVGVADQSQEEGTNTDHDPPGTPLRPLSSSRDEDVSPEGAGPPETDLLVGSLSDRLEQQELQMDALRGTIGDLVRIMQTRFGSEAPDREQRARGPVEPEAGRAPLLHGGSSGFPSDDTQFALRRRSAEEMEREELRRELQAERERSEQLAAQLAALRRDVRPGVAEQMTGEQADLLREFSFLAGTGQRRKLDVPQSVTKQRARATTDPKTSNKADAKLADLKSVRKFTPDLARVMGFSQWYEDNLEREFGLMNPNEATCIMYLRAYVEESMYTTLQSTMKSDIANLNVWLNGMASLYPDKEFVSTYVAELGSTVQKRDEIVTLYLTRLAGVWNKAHPKRAPIMDSEFVEVFVKGMTKKLRDAVGKAGAHQSLVKAVSVARTKEKELWTVRDLNEVAKGAADKKVDKKKTPCRYFAEGNCRKGDKCSFLHSKTKVNRVAGGARAATQGNQGGQGGIPPTQPWGQAQANGAGWWGAQVNAVPGDRWRCTLLQCATVPPHMYVDCVAPGRICKKCKRGGHHEARCPQERCESCGKRGIAWWLCCKRREEVDHDRERDRRGEERGARGGRGGGRGGRGGARSGNGTG